MVRVFEYPDKSLKETLNKSGDLPANPHDYVADLGKSTLVQSFLDDVKDIELNFQAIQLPMLPHGSSIQTCKNNIPTDLQ